MLICSASFNDKKLEVMVSGKADLRIRDMVIYENYFEIIKRAVLNTLQ